MIKYSLRCDQEHVFEGWFRNSDDCEMQTREGHLQCPFCGSSAISKSLMSPKLSGTGSQNKERVLAPASGPQDGSAPVALPAGDPDQQKVQQMLRAFRDHVVANSDYVGNKFAEEARKMHFKEAEPRGIYGEATVDEVKSLTEDGIDCLPIPSLPEDQN